MGTLILVAGENGSGKKPLRGEHRCANDRQALLYRHHAALLRGKSAARGKAPPAAQGLAFYNA